VAEAGPGLANLESYGGERNKVEEQLPPLDGVPQIFFDTDFNLSNPRTFDLVTERIRLSPNSSPQPPSVERFGDDDPTRNVQNEPIPGLGPLTLADLAADQILQEKLSHYTAVIESHLVREIGVRSSSFFAALSTLQSLHQQGEDCLAKITELQSALAPGEKGVGASARKGLAVLRQQARRRGLESIDKGIRAVEDVASGVEGVRDLVEHGEWMGALEVAEQVEALYLGSASPSGSGKGKMPINLTKVKALDTVPKKLAQLRAQIGKSLESELVGVLDHETSLAVEEYKRSAPNRTWKGKAKDVFQDEAGGEEAGEARARERARDRARPIVTGLVRADGLEGAIAAWRESVLRDVRAVVRVVSLRPRLSIFQLGLR
jgi:vacuolar protein sorting-associated protein 54